MYETITKSVFICCRFSLSFLDYCGSQRMASEWLDSMTDGIYAAADAAYDDGHITFAERCELVDMLAECRDMQGEAERRIRRREAA